MTMSAVQSLHLRSVLREVFAERVRQDEKFPDQWDLPDGTSSFAFTDYANFLRRECDKAFKEGRGTFRHILEEEVAEAIAESEPAGLRAELVQVAAVAVKWIEAIDRRERKAA